MIWREETRKGKRKKENRKQQQKGVAKYKTKG